jgi:hypothetical protein
MNPQFEDETPVNPFDLWEGANFKIKIRKIDGFSNYDKSEFENPTPLDEDEGKMESIWKTEHSLEEFTDPKNFKTYAELKEKLDRVLGITTTTPTPVGDVPFDGGKPMTTPQVAPAVTATAESETTSDEYSYFAKLAE